MSSSPLKSIALALIIFFSCAKSFCQTAYQKDFEYYWKTVNDNFAYFDRPNTTNWKDVKTIYEPQVAGIKTDEAFLHFIEKVNNELYNGHVFLNRNAQSSNRTVPTGCDLKITYKNRRYMVTEVRKGYNADLCGIKRGMNIIAFNDSSMADAVPALLPKSVSTYTPDMYDYAATMLVAGTHDKPRKITATWGGKKIDFYPDSIPNKTEKSSGEVLDAKIVGKNVGYIKINNSLGDDDLIPAFNKAVDSLMQTDGMIIDLRETPSGGTTTIARAMMGRFIEKEMPYQKHIYTAEERETGIHRATLELVSPIGKPYAKPMVILVGYWTGSMGEGIAIGFDGMKRAKVAGSKMACLLGEIYSFEMPETKIPFSFPCVKLQHVNGQPREDFMPLYWGDESVLLRNAALSLDKK